MFDALLSNIDDLAEKYGLSEDTIQRTVETSIGTTLSQVFGFEVQAFFDRDKGLTLHGYHTVRGEFVAREIPVDQIRKNIVRLMKYNVVDAFIKQSVIAQYEQLKGLVTSVKRGMVVRTGETIYLELEDVYSETGGVIAVCTKKEQPVRERNKYYKGQILPFYVLRVQAVYEDGVPKLEICLSRRSFGLVENMLREHCPGVRIKCVRRIAGAISEVLTDKPIPKEIIKLVGTELEERIKVTYKQA